MTRLACVKCNRTLKREPQPEANGMGPVCALSSMGVKARRGQGAAIPAQSRTKRSRSADDLTQPLFGDEVAACA